MRSAAEIRADLSTYHAGEKDDRTSFESLDAWMAAMPGVVARREAWDRLVLDIPLLLDALLGMSADDVTQLLKSLPEDE